MRLWAFHHSSLFFTLLHALDLLARICTLRQPRLLHTTDCCVNLQTGFVSKPDKAWGRIRLILPAPAWSFPWVQPWEVLQPFRLQEDHGLLETVLLMLSYVSREYLNYRWHPGESLKSSIHFGHTDNAPCLIQLANATHLLVSLYSVFTRSENLITKLCLVVFRPQT